MEHLQPPQGQGTLERAALGGGGGGDTLFDRKKKNCLPVVTLALFCDTLAIDRRGIGTRVVRGPSMSKLINSGGICRSLRSGREQVYWEAVQQRSG